LIYTKPNLRLLFGQLYPYILVDEAQDTFESVMEAFNALCSAEGLPIIGYFGDPMQQIYDNQSGNFHGPEGSLLITKEENYRSSPQVITLLNAFRKDLTQYAAGKNTKVEGSVLIT